MLRGAKRSKCPDVTSVVICRSGAQRNDNKGATALRGILAIESFPCRRLGRPVCRCFRNSLHCLRRRRTDSPPPLFFPPVWTPSFVVRTRKKPMLLVGRPVVLAYAANGCWRIRNVLPLLIIILRHPYPSPVFIRKSPPQAS